MDTMMRWVLRIRRHRAESFHWLGSDAPEIMVTLTGIAVLMTLHCCSTRATVGAKNQETCDSALCRLCLVKLSLAHLI